MWRSYPMTLLTINIDIFNANKAVLLSSKPVLKTKLAELSYELQRHNGA